MNKAIVVTAIGPDYEALFHKVAPTFERYAERHDWDVRVITRLPDGFERLIQHRDWDKHTLYCAFRLYQPTMFADYDLVALMDPDIIINPSAPCLSKYEAGIPVRGLAAAQDVTYAERKLFPGWVRCHYDHFLPPDQVARLPFPELHVNGGVVLVRPSEVKDEFAELICAEGDHTDEDLINLSFTQRGRVLLLPREWNAVYPYELVRRGYTAPKQLRYPWARWASYQFDIRVRQQRRVKQIFRDVWVLHFASTDRNVVRHLDVLGLLSVNE